jgi:hypothetical protein
MSHYWKKCPHCGKTFEDGYGTPNSSFGNPNRVCRFCGKPFRDRNIIDWRNASKFRKFLFYFANGRFGLCMLVAAFAAVGFGRIYGWESTLGVMITFSISFLIMVGLCVAFAEISARDYFGLGPDKKWFRVLAAVCNIIGKYFALSILLLIIVIVAVAVISSL